MSAETYIAGLQSEFERNANPQIAAGQKAYMRNRFEFFGIKTPLRRQIQKPFLAGDFLPEKAELEPAVKTLWSKPQREFQYFAQELTAKYKKQFDGSDIELLEFMITNKSWWDTVDFIAAKLVGEYFKIYRHRRETVLEKWLASGNIWLQRSSVLFQLNYKEELDTELLSFIINSLLGSDEFFVNKAIGWILRQYSKVNPVWVREFVNKTPLDKLSRKEAVRNIEIRF